MLGSSLYLIALLAVSGFENPEITTVISHPTAQTDCSAKKSLSDEEIDNNLYSAEITPTEQPVIITNNISQDMLAYKHWTGTYSPEKFILYINDTIVESGQTYILTNASAPLTIHFDYSFMKGMHKGTKKSSFLLHEKSTTVNLTFSWLNTWKVIADNATPLKEESL